MGQPLKRAEEVTYNDTSQEQDTDSTTSYQDFQKVKDRAWPENLYKTSKIEEGSPLGNAKNCNLAVFIEQDDENMNQGIQQDFKSRFPYTVDIEGPMGILQISTTAVNRGKNVLEHEYNEEDIFKRIKELREEMVREDRKRVAFPKPNLIKLDTIRNITESIFYRDEVEVTIDIPKTRRNSTRSKEESENIDLKAEKETPRKTNKERRSFNNT
ncbi:hypothetical protein Zmor_005424 [Zophobas morio]|uniref:Uncharacterized protein n=1 Tax=Zophobas morio TaxID=2755281 RepID=A0AA38MLV9_9CUCU|nr:hypothetical protein Zmor_005424 [Zophobas morio]